MSQRKTISQGKKSPTQFQVSAGGVVYRLVGDQVEVVLCGRWEPPIWGLPKGAPEPGESLEEAAVREVREETGLEVTIQAKIGAIRYWFMRDGIRYFKVVHHYLMVPKGGSLSKHDLEHDEVRWFSLEDGLATLSYSNEAEIVRKGIALVSNKTLTTPV